MSPEGPNLLTTRHVEDFDDMIAASGDDKAVGHVDASYSPRMCADGADHYTGR